MRNWDLKNKDGRLPPQLIKRIPNCACLLKQSFLALVAILAIAPPFFLPSSAATNKAVPNKVIVIKSMRVLVLLRDDEILKTYKISLGKNPVGHKIQQGDFRTPEGTYLLDVRNPRSKYHLAFHLSYPNRTDVLSAREAGVSPGGDIMIHGAPNKRSYLDEATGLFDWTDGCIALKNADIEDMWSLVSERTPIEIRP
jgi:murein L,D-transpeptidase YafK